ncbi:hypothetical protein B4N89_27655 [Embleya scabrispora]|uniref:Uncharacterized protein n=2 Tax=Embleya scabrispora TaxID=159449 RepID=A0A1T3P5G2_9ACTN|nr:hypothetical protein B4N89_27655 [Embleya scabrispora]
MGQGVTKTGLGCGRRQVRAVLQPRDHPLGDAGPVGEAGPAQAQFGAPVVDLLGQRVRNLEVYLRAWSKACGCRTVGAFRFPACVSAHGSSQSRTGLVHAISLTRASDVSTRSDAPSGRRVAAPRRCGCAEGMNEHPIVRLTERVMQATGLDQAQAEALVRQVWDEGVAEGTRRMMADLAAAQREAADLRAQLGEG